MTPPTDTDTDTGTAGGGSRFDWTTIGIVTVGVLLVAGGAAAVFVGGWSQPAQATVQVEGFEMEDAAVTVGPDEEVWMEGTEFWISDGTVEYEGFRDVARIGHELYIEGPDGEMQQIATHSVEDPVDYGIEAETSQWYEEYDRQADSVPLFFEADDPLGKAGWAAADLDPGEPGTVAHEIRVTVVIGIYDAELDEVIEADASDTFTLTVEREDPNAGVDPAVSIGGTGGMHVPATSAS